MISLSFAPFLSVALAIVLLISAHFARWSANIILALVGICFAAAWFLGFTYPSTHHTSWGIAFDSFGALGTQLMLPALLSISIMSMESYDYNKKIGALLLVLLSGIGAIAILLSHNWMVFFLAIQCMSIPIYALIASDTNNPIAIATSIRYLILSAIAMGFMLFGILLLYSATGTLDFYEQAGLLPSLWQHSSSFLFLSFTLILVGIGFKLSIFPMHFWTPEVYQGSPFFVVALMIIVGKSVILVALLRSWHLLFHESAMNFVHLVGILAILSMWIGNGLMLMEKNFMRLIAFLSIGHLGFLLTALLVRNKFGIEAIFIDLSAFGFTMLIIFAVLKSINTFELKSLIYTHPKHALLLCLALISLMGFPLTPGFMGKYSVFAANFHADFWQFLPHMILTSIMGVCALAKVLVTMFEKPYEYVEKKSTALSPFLVLSFIGLLFFGIFPQLWLSWITSSIQF